MPSKKQILDFWLDYLMEIEKGDSYEDLRQACFACGLNKLDLYRCHIYPRSLGGSDGVENIHLLCRNCHDASEYKHSKDYFDWLKKRNAFHTIQILASYGNLNFNEQIKTKRNAG